MGGEDKLGRTHFVVQVKKQFNAPLKTHVRCISSNRNTVLSLCSKNHIWFHRYIITHSNITLNTAWTVSLLLITWWGWSRFVSWCHARTCWSHFCTLSGNFWLMRSSSTRMSWCSKGNECSYNLRLWSYFFLLIS